MAKPEMIYKVTALKLLSKALEPLSNAQISDFFLTQDYTDYFTVQKCLNELENIGYIESKRTHGNTRYTLTEKGTEALELMKDKLTEEISTDISEYLSTNNNEIKNENAPVSYYEQTRSGNYRVHCSLKDDKETILDMSLTVSSSDTAETLCTNFNSNYEDIYAALLEGLMK